MLNNEKIKIECKGVVDDNNIQEEILFLLEDLFFALAIGGVVGLGIGCSCCIFKFSSSSEVGTMIFILMVFFFYNIRRAMFTTESGLLLEAETEIETSLLHAMEEETETDRNRQWRPRPRLQHCERLNSIIIHKKRMVSASSAVSNDLHQHQQEDLDDLCDLCDLCDITLEDHSVSCNGSFFSRLTKSWMLKGKQDLHDYLDDDDDLPFLDRSETMDTSIGSSDSSIMELYSLDSSTTNISQDINTIKSRSIKFADEEGAYSLETVHYIMEDEEEYGCNICFKDEGSDEDRCKSILIMLLHPQLSKFEILHAEYSTSSYTTIQSLLHQIPSMTLYPVMANQNYIHLCRLVERSGKKNELGNMYSIQSYNLPNDEILVAVPNTIRTIITGQNNNDVTGISTSSSLMIEQTRNLAKELVKHQKPVRDAIRRTIRWGTSLHKIEEDIMDSAFVDEYRL